jgi:hypothetical protein
MLTPQQHEQSQKQSAADEKKARLHAEIALRHHGFVPKWERRKRRVGEDIKKCCFGDEEGGGSSLPEALIRPQHDDEKLMKEAVQVPPESDMNTAADAATTRKQNQDDSWIPLFHQAEHHPSDEIDDSLRATSCYEDNMSCEEVNNDNDWVPLVPLNAEQSTEQLLDSSNDDSDVVKYGVTNQLLEVVPKEVGNADEESKVQKEENNNNMLLWIGGGALVAGAVVGGLAIANSRKKNKVQEKEGENFR